MRTLHIIMPMAGEGSRFKEASYDVPKPLIQYKGIELYRRSLSSLSVSQYSDINVKYTFIVRKEFIDDYNIDKEINKYYPYANIITVDKTTRGALETIMLAEQYIDDEDCVVSMDCDIEFLCQGYVNKICEKLNFRSMYPMVLSFYSKNPIYSFVKVIGKNTGTFVAEKIPISTYALGGCYYLGLGKNLKKAAKKYIADFESGKIKIKELYLSEVINYIIDIIDGFIDVYDMDLHNDHYWSFGTPYDLENHKFEKNIWDE